ncbi:MAG: hypothetical protein EOP67_49785, partial [Sphingomonas sp.]
MQVDVVGIHTALAEREAIEFDRLGVIVLTQIGVSGAGSQLAIGVARRLLLEPGQGAVVADRGAGIRQQGLRHGVGRGDLARSHTFLEHGLRLARQTATVHAVGIFKIVVLISQRLGLAHQPEQVDLLRLVERDDAVLLKAERHD